MKKSEVTRQNILKKGMEFASTYGLLSLTIGEMAKSAKMSRTGVISHFANKEDMQIAILKFTEDEFRLHVLKKSYDVDPLKNLNNLKSTWLNWITGLNFDQKASCPFIKASIEYLDRPDCLVRTYMKDQQKRLILYLADIANRCKENKYFDKNCDSMQFAYEFDTIYMGHVIQKGLFEDPTLDQKFAISIEGLIKRYLIG